MPSLPKGLSRLGIRAGLFAKSLQLLMSACVPFSITISATAVDDLRIYVVKVYGASAPGSGVVIKSDKRQSVILTAGHVVRDTSAADSPYILTHDHKKYPIAQISIHSTLDLAELTVLESLQPAPTSFNVHNGGDIILVGFPQASTKSLLLKGSSQPQSLLSDTRPGGYGLVHSAKSSTGFSGGGIFDQSGSLVGIHGQADTSRLQSGRFVKTGFALAIPVSFWSPSITGSIVQMTDAQRTNDHLAEISYLRSAMKYEEAIEKVSKLVVARPQDGALRLLRANLYIDLKQPLLSLDDLELAEVLMPSSSAVHANKGIAYFLQGNLELSLNSYEQAIKLDPDISDIYINKSKVLLKLRRPVEALEALNVAIKSNKQNAHIYIERARVHHDLGHYPQAKDDLEIYIRSYPDDAIALSLMGSISGKLGNTKESYSYFSQAADLEPTSSMFALNRAVALAEAGDRDNAIKEIRIILSDCPKFLPAMANLSELLFLNGEKSESCQLAHEVTKMGYSWIESEWDSVFLSSCSSDNRRLLK